MSSPNVFADFMTSYGGVIVFVASVFLFVAFWRGILNMILGIRNLFKKHNPL